MDVLGMQMQENGTADYQQFMKDDVERYVSLVKRLGIATQISRRGMAAEAVAS